MSLFVLMSGLPGVGKSAIADALGRALPAAVIGVDEVEAAILGSGIERSFETGLAAYRVGAALAAHQLRIGGSVIVDAANYLDVGRQIWLSAIDGAAAEVRTIEVVCSDEAVHRARLECRQRGLEPLPEPTWHEVMRQRDATEPWTRERLVLDTVSPLEANVGIALAYLARRDT